MDYPYFGKKQRSNSEEIPTPNLQTNMNGGN